MNKGTIISFISILIVSIVLIILTIYNINCNCSFFELSISEVINIGLTLFIATYLFKLQSRTSRKRVHCLDLIDNLISHLEKYSFSGVASDNLMNDKKISQLTSLIELYTKIFKFETELNSLKQQGELYRIEFSKNVDKLLDLDESNLNLKNLNFNTINILERMKIKILS